MLLKKAKEKSFTQNEIDEAAWMGISQAFTKSLRKKDIRGKNIMDICLFITLTEQ